MHYYLIGICGVSMSGLARLLKKQGNIVSGSDLKKCVVRGEKLKVYVGHDAKHITSDVDEVIYTSAVDHKDAPGYVELKKARDLGIKITKRSKFIGRLMSHGDPALKASGNDKIGIAITGMHGKTTVSTMVSLILEAAEYNPTCLIGANVKEWKSNVKVGSQTDKDIKSPFYRSSKTREYIVAEACEYDRQMLDFRPKVALITNMEEEHLDTYPKGMKDIKQAFKKFVKLLPKNGLLILCADDKNVAMLKKYAKCKVKYYSIKKPWPGLKLQIPGKHNLQNATGAARLCHELGVDSKTIKKTLNNFTGATRRFEIKGEKNGVLVIDDYGHHPTEIKATLQSTHKLIEKIRNPKSEIRNNIKFSKSKILNIKYKKISNLKSPFSKLILVYQPHQQQRTKLLFDDFVTSFDQADKIIMTDVYLIAGREKHTKENLAKKLVEEIKKRGKDIIYISGYDKIAEYLKKEAKSGDLILTMGATDIYKVGEKFLS